MLKFDPNRSFHLIGSLTERCLVIVRWPLPERAAYRAVVVLTLALLPFLPMEWITVIELKWGAAGLAIALALWACLDRITAALLILREGRQTIYSKQFGLRHDLSELKSLHDSPRSGLPLLLLVVLVVGCTLVLATASITYSLINHLEIGDVFRNNSSNRFAVLLYYADEAVRGMTFRFFDIFGIEVPDKLQTVHSVPYALFMWGYRLAFVLLVFQASWLAALSLFAEVDPEITRLYAEINQARAVNFELLREVLRPTRARIFKAQNDHGGNLLPDQRSELKSQLDALWGRQTPEFDEIKEALKRDDRVNGRIKSPSRGQKQGRGHWRRRA